MDKQSAAQSGESAVELTNVTKIFGQVVAVRDLNLAIGDGEFFSLLGPSGCGKTTTLRMIAGFEDPTEGEIYLKSRPVAGTPAYKRPVNTVFQSYALFPHMSVYDNVAFGLEMKKVGKEEINSRVLGALELVQLPGMADRKPKQLSGGQQQRIALARALVNQPQVLLLDEPLGALDLKLRKAMQLELKQIQSNVGITFIYVTHDQEEALTMSNRIAVMSLGEVQQVGQPREIYEHPANRFVADFIGETNFIEAVVVEPSESATLAIGKIVIKAAADGRSLAEEQEVTLAIRPEKLNLFAKKRDLEKTWFTRDELNQLVGRSEVSIRSEGDSKTEERRHIVVGGEVLEAIYIGTDTRYQVMLGDQISVFVRMQNFGAEFDTKFEAGDQVYVHWLMENGQVLTN